MTRTAPGADAWRLALRRGGPGLVVADELRAGQRRLSFGDVVERWRIDPAFRRGWTRALRDVGLGAFCWECPPLTRTRLASAFECVFVESPRLAGRLADATPFAEHLQGRTGAATFASLGGDAVLVAPCAGGPAADFAHLATFLATADDAQADSLWRAVGDALAARLGDRPVWLSTAGLGVDWLHVRLDSRPKYYRHAPYARGVDET